MNQVLKQQLLETAINSGALTFGSFKLKSGRISPYFFNAGKLSDGPSLQTLGHCYAEVISEHFPEAGLLFGPAYKGIPMVCATSVVLAQQKKASMPFCYNRKEAKTHGEGGVLVGAEVKGNVVILDDVITAGTAIRESVVALSSYSDCNIVGCVVALDRQERGPEGLSAVEAVTKQYGFPVRSLLNLSDLVEFANREAALNPYLADIQRYQSEFGL